MAAYRQSKIAVGLLGLELDRRSHAEGRGITSNLSRPGSPRLPGDLAAFDLGDAALGDVHAVGDLLLGEAAGPTDLGQAVSDGLGEHLAFPGVDCGFAACPLEEQDADGAGAVFLEVGDRGPVNGVDERTSKPWPVVGEGVDGLDDPGRGPCDRGCPATRVPRWRCTPPTARPYSGRG